MFLIHFPPTKFDSLSEGIDFSCNLTRARFEELCMDYFRNRRNDSYSFQLNKAKVVLVGAINFNQFPPNALVKRRMPMFSDGSFFGCC